MFEIKSQIVDMVSKLRGLLKTGKGELPLPSLAGIDRKLPESYFSLSQGRSKLRLFPAKYQECFDMVEPVQDDSLFIGRDEEMAALEDALDLWLKGNPCSVAIIGHSGCGKTSLLHFFQKKVGREIIVKKVTVEKRLATTRDVLSFFEGALGLDSQRSGAQDLADVINGMPRRVVLLENFHMAFLRALSCHEALRTFLYLIMSTSKNWMWVVSVDYYPWLKMEYLYSMSTYFTCDVTLSRLEKSRFKEVFLTRQKASGYELSSATAAEEKSEESEHMDPSALDTEAQHAAFMETYFEDLYRLSGGNIQSALVYWLYCLEYEEEKHEVAIRPIEKPDFSFLSKMDRLHLFSLAEILNHGSLTAREHGLLFGLGEFESLLVLEFLQNKKVLERGAGGDGVSDDRFRLNPFFSQPVASLLQEKNILY